MNILLIYYTGTYNTRYLSCRAEEALAARGHAVTRVEIRRGTPVADTQGFDLIGFGYPIYGFNSPLPFNRYVKKLNIARGQKFFIYKNSGETFAVNNASSRILLRRMRKKGAIFAGEYHFVMPYNIHFAYDRPFVREILEKDEKLMRIMIHRLETGSAPKIQSNFWYNVASAAVSVQKIGGTVNSFFYRADMHKCVQCMRCVRDCPENNIRFEKGKIRFGLRCDMCMRCSFFCPTDAIKIGFLQGWKVNGDYRLAEIANDPLPEKPYIDENSRGFFKCFIRTFREIDEQYAALFPAQNEDANTAETDEHGGQNTQ